MSMYASGQLLQTYLADIDACITFTKGMAVSQFCHNCDGIEASVLRKSRRNNL